MYKLDLPVDLKESASIERRRLREQQRQSRVFNARVRTIGVDLQVLDQQAEERKWMEEQERRRSEAFAHDMVRNDKIASLLQQRQDHDIRVLNKSINEFRQKYQQTEDRREFDIYDPEGKKKDKPARICDDDPRCGVSSMQKFLGEDLNEKARKKLQQEQHRDWMQQQMNEKAQEEANLKQAQRLYELKTMENDQRAMELACSEQTCRQAVNMATKNYNMALARERQSKEDADKEKQSEDNFTEISNHVFGDILTENPAVAQSAFGSHRVIPDRWKGMSPAELNAIRYEQQQQIEEQKRLAEEQSQKDSAWNKQMLNNSRAAIMQEREQERLRKELMKQQAEENLRLSAEQKNRLNHLDKEMYTNQPTAAYFMQFNTTSR